jgi:hypothetical protein
MIDRAWPEAVMHLAITYHERGQDAEDAGRYGEAAVCAQVYVDLCGLIARLDPSSRLPEG